MKAKIIYLIILLALALSCKKEDVVIPAVAKDVPILKGVKASDQPQVEYVYNVSKLVTEEKSKYSYTTYHYNEKKQLTTTDYYINQDLLSTDATLSESALNQKGLINFINTVLEGTLRYEYNTSGQLVKSTTIRPSENTTEYSEYKYDNTNRIGRETMYWDSKVLGYIDYLYDDIGNLKSETLYSIPTSGIAELNTITVYEFDNMKNPFKSLQSLVSPGINTNPNNITKETYTIHSSEAGVADIVQVTFFSYTYNSQGYPVKKNSTVEFLY